MRRDIHARRGDEKRDRQQRKRKAAVGEKEHAEKSRRRSSVSAGERIVFRTQTRAVPAEFLFDRRAGRDRSRS